MRISSELDNDITTISEKLGYEKAHFMRLLMNRALKDLKQDANKAGGFENLDYSMR